MNKFESEIQGKKVLIFGLGRQGGGTGDAEWLKSHGANVRISDRDLTLCPEGQTKEQIEWADIIIKNPGVPDDHELIIYGQSLKKPIYTSIAVFVKHTQIITIGVTGTRGKSTTVALITAVLEAAYPGKIVSGGNIAGTSCLSLFDQLENKLYAVLELSSFQLHNFHDLEVSPNISLVTNLYPDHLNRYPDIDSYQKDKEAICKYQDASDLCIYNEANAGATSIASLSPATKISYNATTVLDWETNLPGLHNRENIAAMWAIAKALNIDENIARQVVKDFAGLPFRQELIKVIDGVSYINDTTSTTPTASIKALQASASSTIWITGGDTKKLPFTELIKEVENNKNLKSIIILGSKNISDYTDELKRVAGPKIVGNVFSMNDAITLARKVAVAGDNVLLSPGFASFDLFQNEFDRGRQFNEIVRAL